MKIINIDYAGHPFIYELSKKLSKKHSVYHCFADFFSSPKANLINKKSLRIVPIKSKTKFIKNHFLSRRRIEINFGHSVIQIIKNIKPDLIICAQIPLDPLENILNFTKNSSIKSIYWVQDIYSEAIKKIINKKIPILGSLLGFYYKRKEISCQDKSDKIIIITKEFQKYISKKNKKKINFVENWSALSKPKNKLIKSFKQKFKFKKKIIAIYSGTLGYKHNINFFLNLANKYKEVIFILSSKGNFADEINVKKKELGLKNLRVIGWVNYKDFSSFLSIADLYIVLLSADASTFSVPSKIYSYLLMKKHILASMPKNNLGSKNIVNFKSGYVSEPNDNETLYKNFDKIINKIKFKKKISNNYSFTKKKNLNKLIKIIEKF